MGNVLLIAERSRRIEMTRMVGFLQLVETLSRTVEQESPKHMLTEILPLSRAHQITTCDASYLDVAMRSGLPIAALDHSLKRTAGKCGVALLSDRQKGS